MNKPYLMPLKALLLFFVIAVISQSILAQTNKQYNTEWKTIDSLYQKAGLPQSALKEINTIYLSAKKEDNQVQVIKALIYRMAINDQVSENGRYENIRQLEAEITTAKEPAKSILSSIAGESYWHYLQMNRWQFYNRSRTTTNNNSNDISTLDITELYNRITTHYLNSVKNFSLLQKTNLESYNAIIEKGNVRHLRPTLYDLLAHRALEYFRNDERYITKPAYAFEISDSTVFADVVTFTTHNFATRDTLSLHHKALRLYQDLLKFHQSDQSKPALIDADINRIQFAYNFSTHPGKDLLYKQALERIISNHGKVRGISDAMYLLAQWYWSRGINYNPIGDTSNRYEIVNAKQWCERAIATREESEGRSNAVNLLTEITAKQISIEAEKVNVPNEPFRILLSYKNAARAYLKIIRVDEDVRQSFRRDQWQDSIWRNLVNATSLQDLEYALPATSDLQQHRAEAKVDPLPAGEYAMIASSENSFDLKKGTLSVVFFHVSNLAYIRSAEKHYVLNRQSGMPLSGAVVEVWTDRYDYQKQRNVLRSAGKYTTDKEGYFRIKRPSGDALHLPYRLDFRYGKDRLFLDDQAQFSYVYELPQNSEQTYLFTDRSIYRPGQLVYFKGIQVHRDKKYSNEVIANKKSVLELLNANGELVDSVTLTSNEFGSYNGKFILPAVTLNGEFRIRDRSTSSEVIIRIEEYKRPKFFVEIAQPKGTYRLNDSITVEATSMAFSGNNVNDASVNYRVVRKMQMPMWRHALDHRTIWPPYGSQEVEIKHGTGRTDANGKFFITFTALPDLKVSEELQPVFYFEVYADVTDVSGETRSAVLSVPVSYQALKLRLSVPENEFADSLKKISVHTTNIIDSFEAAMVKVSIYKIAEPARLFRERLWNRPDQFIMSREEYYKSFPYDQYDNETEVGNWKKEKLMFEKQLTTTNTGELLLTGATFEPGWYVVEATTTDKYKKTVVDKRYMSLIRGKNSGPLFQSNIIVHDDVVKAGDIVKYEILHNIDSAYIINEIVSSVDTARKILRDASQSFTVGKDYKGSVNIKTVIVKHNRIYSQYELLPVNTADTNILINYVTFRDRVQPGSKERWTVNVSGIQGQKVSAELLTAMYDASLDQFYPHQWNSGLASLLPIDTDTWTGDYNFYVVQSAGKNNPHDQPDAFVKLYDRLKIASEGGVSYMSNTRPAMARAQKAAPEALQGAVKGVVAQNVVVADGMGTEERDASSTAGNVVKADAPRVQPRTNMNETAFFFPELRTDDKGNIEFTFTTPDALTTWKWMMFAHTRSFKTHVTDKEIVAQKDLMVQPNIPRFIRQGDEVDISAKVTNMTDRVLSGNAELNLIDPFTGKNINAVFSNTAGSKSFSVQPKQSAPVRFRIRVPQHFSNLLTWRITATTSQQGGSLSDGEQAMVPVISNRMLVTETLVMPVKGNTKKDFTFEKLLNSGNSKTLRHHALTVEFTSNPSWYAVQALPYLVEGEKENAEQVFNRFYANALAARLINSSPKVRSVIEKWKDVDTSALLSNLSKNEELKSVLLEETPWVLDAKNEAQQKKNIALLFDMARMDADLGRSLSRLSQMQAESGGFVWLQGAPEDRYMTQYIVTGIGRLRKLQAVPAAYISRIDAVAKKALQYLDRQIKLDYDKIRKLNLKLPGSGIDNIQAQYLYTRSFFSSRVSGDIFPAFNYFRNEARKNWVKEGTYIKGMIALALFRNGDHQSAKKIIASLKETSISNDEMGMYWKDITAGYYWYQAPVETHALMIETFSEISNDTSVIDQLKTWLLKNKQTRNWKTSKATADACYALLLRGSAWISAESSVSIKTGDRLIVPSMRQEGSGYFKTIVPGDSISVSMGKISLSLQSKPASTGPSWGAVYWQYFEDLDKITAASSPLSIRKQVMITKNTDSGPVLDTLAAGNTLKVGDKVKVRIEIRSDRDLEYVHMKDMRASAFEPVNVLSSYKWQGRLGYYESTKDASVNFYFNFLPKGVHIFEYDLFATQTGSFSNGITSIQCMYAPEFSSHSEGIKVNVSLP